MIDGRGIAIVGTSINPSSRETILHILKFITVGNRYTDLATRYRFGIFTFVLLSSIRETVHANIWKSKNAIGLIIVVIFRGITMIVLVAVTFLLLGSFQKGNCEEMCQTISCLETAVRVLKSMNETVQPCDDFFEFACRGWITKNPIPNHELSWSTLKIVDDEIELRLHSILNTPDKEEDGRPIKMARALYRNCMDSKSVENVGFKPLVDALRKLGLPMMPPTDEEAAHLDIPKIAGSVLRHYGKMFFVGSLIDQDPNNSSMYRLVLQQVSPDSKNLDVYLRDPVRFNTAVEEKKHYIRGMMQITKKDNETYTDEIMNFMTELAKIMATPEDRASKNYRHDVMTIWELQNLTDPDAKHWNWTTYMNAMFDKTDVIIDPKNDTAHIQDMDYFKGLPSLLSKTPRRIIALYVWWEVVSLVAPQTLQVFRDWGAHFGKLPQHFELGSPTWQGCIETVKHFFKLALTEAYVKKHFNVQNKKTANEMWTNLTSSFDEMLTESKWMDDKTKAQAHRKLRNMKALIAYPEWIMDPKKLEEYYKEYEVLEGSLVHMYTNFESIERKRHLNHWRQTLDRNSWLISGTDVLTRPSPSRNTIKNLYHEYRLAIASGYLHEPFYENAAEALNYGAIGTLIAHEVTHGFDHYGQRYDENTTVREWWSEEALKHYKDKVDCVIKQYSEFEVTQLGKNVMLDGTLTKDENVADMGGLAVAFKAYKKLKARSQPQQAIPGLAKYTDEQLFFIGYAQMWCDSYTDADLKYYIKEDPHSPGRFRIIGSLRNSAEFAKVWNCPSGSPMNPEKKCTVW